MNNHGLWTSSPLAGFLPINREIGHSWTVALRFRSDHRVVPSRVGVRAIRHAAPQSYFLYASRSYRWRNFLSQAFSRRVCIEFSSPLACPR